MAVVRQQWYLAELEQSRVLTGSESRFEHLRHEVTAAASRVARAYRLSASDADDLRSDLWLKVLENKRTLRTLRARARPSSYLVAIARNLLLDQRNKSWGKWRPSAAARRAGGYGIALDRLVTRDGLSVDVAQAMLRCAGKAPGDCSVSTMTLEFPSRLKRVFVGVEAVDAVSIAHNRRDISWDHERRRVERLVQQALTEVLAGLPHFDRQLLKWRFVDDLTIAAMAPRVRMTAGALYRHFSRLLRDIRMSLEQVGVDLPTVRSLLVDTCRSLSCELLATPSALPGIEREIA
jgi:RNA polymerase sigma factor (sigma-70 family)